MFRKGMIGMSLFLAIFILACQPGGVQIPENGTAIETQDTADGCLLHAECVDENYLHFQANDCSWSRPEKCDRGCVNASCKPAEVCTVGFKCIDENRKGYQKEDCSFVNKITCEGGCSEGKCNEVSNATVNNTTNATTSSNPSYSYIAENADENETVDSPLYTLQLGEVQEITIGGSSHNISIHNLEVEKVIIKIDGVKSDWIIEGGSFTYANLDATVHIKSILFQGYGKKEIEYYIS